MANYHLHPRAIARMKSKGSVPVLMTSESAGGHPAAMKRTRPALLLVAMMVSACGASPASAVHSPSTSPTTPAAASSGPLSCRLPVAGFVISAPKGMPDRSIAADGQENQKGTGGFLDLPSGQFTPAPNSDRSYIAGAGWLPVSLQAVSPDHRSYVQGRARQINHEAPTTSLYLVQADTKAERLLFTPADGQMASVVAFTSKGIYAAVGSSTGPGAIDLLLIDPATGAHRPVPGTQPPAGAIQEVFMAISGDFAWGMLVTGSQSQVSIKLVRLSLVDGSVVDWYGAPGSFFIIGFDSAGHPIVGLFDGSTGVTRVDVYLIDDANKAVAIQPHGGTYMATRGSSVTDAHGTWFGSADGSIWLYSSTKGLEKVATIPPQAGATGQLYDQHAWRSVAGPCV